jgi:uncharacterized protein YjbI with pentapeptide repeats
VRAKLDGADMPEAILTGARSTRPFRPDVAYTSPFARSEPQRRTLVERTLCRAKFEGANLNNAG